MQLCNAMHVSLGTLINSILLVGNSAWLGGLHPQSGTGAIASSKGSGWLAWCLSTGIFKSRNSWIRLPNRRSERVSSLKISSPSLPASHLYVQESNKRERESFKFPRFPTLSFCVPKMRILDFLRAFLLLGPGRVHQDISSFCQLSNPQRSLQLAASRVRASATVLFCRGWPTQNGDQRFPQHLQLEGWENRKSSIPADALQVSMPSNCKWLLLELHQVSTSRCYYDLLALVMASDLAAVTKPERVTALGTQTAAAICFATLSFHEFSIVFAMLLSHFAPISRPTTWAFLR